MHSPFAPPSPRAALALLFSLSLVGAAACGDDLDPPDGDDDDGDDGGDDGEPEGIAIEGLDGPVDVYFDEAGILHASCVSDHDCFAVEGYYHAAHRFVQMDIRRRFARGKVAALAGAVALDFDIPQRRMMTTRDGTPLEEKLLEEADDRTVAALEAYSKGVNAWLDDLQAGRNGAALPSEYSFPVIDQDAIIDDWEPLDSVACILPLVDQLTNFVDTDIVAGQIYGALDPVTADELFGLRPPSDSAILPAAKGVRRSPARAAAGRALHERMARSRQLFTRALRQFPDASLNKSSIGSNNWIVAPSNTTGGALLANDPHLSLAHPAIWYLVHLDARSAGEGGDLHVAGASFAGLPGVLLGQNEDIAWGATTTYFDSSDVYVETLTKDGTAVLFDGNEVPLIERDYDFEVSGQDAPTTVTFKFVPHHGPIITDDAAPEVLSVRWTGHDADTDINFFLALADSSTVEEARTALTNVTTAGQNFVVVDRGGNIGWFPYNRLPTRPWASLAVPSWMPVPGDGSAEWGAPIPYEDLPQAFNPAAGYLATANNDMTGALQDGDPTNDDQPFVQAYLDEGYRHQRIIERLAERTDHDLASMQSIQADDFSLLGELLRDPIVALAEESADPDAQAVLDALTAWTDFECPTGLVGTAPDGAADPATAVSARGCAAFHVTWARLRDLVFSDELAVADVDQSAQPSALIYLLTDAGFNQDYWDDVETTDVVETREEIVAQALIEAGAFLRSEAGDPAEWLWGRIHTVTLRADLFSNFVSEFNYPTGDVLPFANDGGLFTVDVANPRNEIANAYDQPNGPSMRFACLADEPGVSCTIELPGGQRHDRGSDYYNSMLDDWLGNRPVPIEFDIAAAAAGAVETVQIQPR
jgi:penicillin amidase